MKINHSSPRDNKWARHGFALAILFAAPALALAGTTSNWLPTPTDATVDNTANYDVAPVFGTTADLHFPTSATTNLYMDSAQTVESLNFDSGGFSIQLATTPGGGTPANLTFDGTGCGIVVASGNSVPSTVGVSDGSLVFNQNLSITNNSSVPLIINRPISSGSSTANLTIQNNSPGTGDVDISGAISDGIGKTMALTQNSAGTLNLTGVNTYTGANKVNQGTLTVGAGGVINNNLSISGTLFNGALASLNSVMNIAGGTVTVNVPGSANNIQLGMANGANSVINLYNNGVLNISRQSWIGVGGANQGAFGAMIISSGTLTTGGGGNAGLSVGRGSGAGPSRGEVIVTGGTLSISNAAGNTQIGSDNVTPTTASSVMSFSGGNTTFLGTGSFIVGRVANGVLDISGTASVLISSNGGALNFAQTAGVVGIANLNGGTLTVPSVTLGSGPGYLDFNGGTLKANKTNSAYMNAMTAVYVYSGGAIIDDGGFPITVRAPFLAPTGSGVNTNGFNVNGSGFIAPPIIDITDSGSTGFGATALATIDTSGNLTGVVMTSPGVNFSGTPQFTFTGGGSFASQSGSASTAANTSGGLTKNGLGRLTLTGTNTYTGTTLVNQGTLAGTAIFAGPLSVAAGATLDPGATAGTIGTMSVSNNLTLNGTSTTVVQVSKDTATSDQITGLVNASYGGTLMVSNIGVSQLAGGESYQLFSASGSISGNFSSIIVQPATGATSATFNPSTGILTISSSIPTTPTNLVFNVSGGNINLSWPSSYLGWSLQMQTNSVSKGLGTNWVTIPGCETVTATNFPVVSTPNLMIFYRMSH